MIWLGVPVVFFSLSQSKLPGYILPALPAATLLLCVYLQERATANPGPGILRIVLHSAVAALTIVPALMVANGFSRDRTGSLRAGIPIAVHQELRSG